MLTLKNIKVNNNIVEADYFPETEIEASHIVVDAQSGEIVDLQEGKGSWEMYSFHAMQSLVRMVKDGEIQSERHVMWY